MAGGPRRTVWRRQTDDVAADGKFLCGPKKECSRVVQRKRTPGPSLDRAEQLRGKSQQAVDRERPLTGFRTKKPCASKYDGEPESYGTTTAGRRPQRPKRGAQRGNSADAERRQRRASQLAGLRLAGRALKAPDCVARARAVLAVDSADVIAAIVQRLLNRSHE